MTPKSLRIYCSFLLAMNLFATLVLVLPVYKTNSSIAVQNGEDRDLLAGRREALERLCYRTGSFVICAGAFLLWRFLPRENKRNLAVCCILGISWLVVNFYFIAFTGATP